MKVPVEEIETTQEDAWAVEIERRATELESGLVRGVSWEELKERLMQDRLEP